MANLRRRILLVTLSLIGGTVLACSIAVYFVAAHSLWRNLDAALLQIAKTEIASATDTGTIHVHETGPMNLAIPDVRGYEKFVWIEDQAGQVLACTKNVLEAGIEGLEQGRTRAKRGQVEATDISINQTRVRALFYPLKGLDGGSLVGVVAVPSADTEQAVAEVGEVALAVGLLCFVIAAITAVLLSEFIAVPLKDLARQIEVSDPSGNTVHERVRAPYAELDTLVSALNELSGKVSAMLSEKKAIIGTQRQFIADTSHELRTPVSNLRGTIEVALRRDRSLQDYQEALRTSLGETKRISRLIDDLLTLAKSDIGEFVIRPVPCDASAIIFEAVRLLNDQRIKFVGPDHFEAKLDPDRFRQALDNLLRNACTHAESIIEVRLESDSQSWYVKVSNDGPDISPDQQEAIFERFVRLDESRNRDTGGSGLGLPIVRAIAEGHGGRVKVTSGNGWTEFRLEFPTQ
ncbi:MAG TPA: ATP-binding protein [Fimbriimonadaceae bacterium]|nr:ATP-binding protein [Fimbriimonadaceae bacterium]